MAHKEKINVGKINKKSTSVPYILIVRVSDRSCWPERQASDIKSSDGKPNYEL
jgi:hypothetical protein